MKKMSKSTLGLLLLFFWTQTIPAAADMPENALLQSEAQLPASGVLLQEFYVNNMIVENMDNAYINQQHQVMIPLDSMMEAMGKSVTYDLESRKVTIYGDHGEQGENKNIPEVVLHPETGTAFLKGKPYQGEGAMAIINQRYYLPLHWIVDFYGYQVYCEEVTRSVYINMDYTMLPEEYKGFRRIENLPKPTYISHAGGMISGRTHTNSREAIEDSLNRGNYFVELDFLFTTDNQVVLGHNWGLMSQLMQLSYFPVSYETFMEITYAGGLTQLDLKLLAEFMTEEERLYVITDAKDDNLLLLTRIAMEYPHLKQRFIPQVYDEMEYEAAVKLGYKHLIYSLYQVYRSDDQVLDFAARYQPYAVTMAAERVNTGLVEKIKAVGVQTYTHTINTEEELKMVQDMGIDGVYTANLPVMPLADQVETEIASILNTTEE